MTTLAPPRVFTDPEPAGLELEITCQRCGHLSVGDDQAPRLRNQRIAGRRYRCAQCGAIGLPSLCTRRLAQHASKVRSARAAEQGPCASCNQPRRTAHCAGARARSVADCAGLQVSA